MRRKFGKASSPVVTGNRRCHALGEGDFERAREQKSGKPRLLPMIEQNEPP
jgi:hypothetical protein